MRTCPPGFNNQPRIQRTKVQQAKPAAFNNQSDDSFPFERCSPFLREHSLILGEWKKRRWDPSSFGSQPKKDLGSILVKGRLEVPKHLEEISCEENSGSDTVSPWSVTLFISIHYVFLVYMAGHDFDRGNQGVKVFPGHLTFYNLEPVRDDISRGYGASLDPSDHFSWGTGSMENYIYNIY